jgi:hypothetical protein
MANTFSARRARHIRRRSQRHSQSANSLGFSELFLAPFEDSAIILTTTDLRLKYWLLGFTTLPPRVVARFRNRGRVWFCGEEPGQSTLRGFGHRSNE